MDAWHRKTIFVQIPAYRDAELVPTLIDMIDRASHPERLHVSVCWQHTDDEYLPLSSHGFVPVAPSVDFGRWLHQLARRQTRIDVADYAAGDSQGCGWARAMAQHRYDGEDYTLQLDSHHRFLDGWDIQLVDMLESLRSRSPWPVLVGHPPAYEPGKPIDDDNERGTRMDFRDYGGPCVVRTRSLAFRAAAPIRARFFSGGFAFADGHFVRVVPADPGQYFNTEEITLSLRAYTHGYDLFHPHRHVLWHYYERPLAPLVWDDAPADGRRRAVEAAASVEMALGMRPWRPWALPMRLGHRRTVEAYERYAGLCFARRAATPEATGGDDPSDADQRLARDAWIAKLRPAPVIPSVP